MWTKEHGGFQEETFNSNHICSRKLKNLTTDRNWIAKKLVHFLWLNHNMTDAYAFKYLAKDYQIQVNEIMIYRALRIVREVVEGSEKEQHAKFWDYYH